MRAESYPIIVRLERAPNNVVRYLPDEVRYLGENIQRLSILVLYRFPEKINSMISGYTHIQELKVKISTLIARYAKSPSEPGPWLAEAG